jgi:hypothetical protein
MRCRHVVLIAGAAVLAACASAPYQPAEYPIKDLPMGKFDVSGEVTVENVQADRGTHVLVGYSPPALGDYATLTQALVDQLRKEIDKDGARLKTGVTKTLRVSVNELGTYVPAGVSVHHVTWLDVAVGLGDAPPAIVQVVSKTNDFSVASYHAYDHALSLAVLEILKNRDVRAYLAQDGAAAPRLKAAVFQGAERAAPPRAAPVAPAGKDATARLKELKAMLDQGLITKEQYDKKRQEILDSM